MEMLRKITLKNCGVTMDVARTALEGKKEGEGVALLRVVGIANSGKPGQTQMGEFFKIMGEFSAINLVTGQQYASGQCILPNFISDQFAGVLMQAGNVEFALEIGAKKDKTSVAGYLYTARPLVESKASERMQALIAAASSGLPQLAAPAAPAPAPAPAAKGGKKK